MDFGLSEEQQMLQETVQSFVENECPLSRLREIFDGDSDYDEKLWRGLAEMGIAGLLIPEQCGGAEMELLDLALVAEVLGAGAVPSPFFGHALATLAIVEGGSDAQKEKWLPDLADGSRLATVALGEAPDRWDPSNWKAEATDGVLNGAKSYVTSADVADWIVVGLAGGELALVARDAVGVKIEPIDSADRTRRSSRVLFCRWNTPRPASSSGGESASSRPSSTSSRTWPSTSSPPARSSGTRPTHSTTSRTRPSTRPRWRRPTSRTAMPRSRATRWKSSAASG